MSAARIERLLNLLTLLLNARAPVSLRQIRDMDEFLAYNTSDPKSGERAFERDKASLIELGVPLVWIAPELDDDDDGMGGYVIDRSRYYMEDLNLDPTELALLSIAGAAAAGIEGNPGRAPVIRALAKLGFDLDETVMTASLAHAPLQEGIDAKRVGEFLDTLHDAIARRYRVRLTYQAMGGHKTDRDVDPWGLYYRHGAWYLVGYCHLRTCERTFHVGRVDAVEPVRVDGKRVEFEFPQDFDLNTHVHRRPWEFPGGAPMQVKVHVAKRIVPAIAEIFGPRAQVQREDSGDAWVTVTANQPDALVTAVLPYGDAAQIVEPQGLREHVAGTYRELAARYRQDGQRKEEAA